VAIRIFDIQAALVLVTKDAARYLSGSDADMNLRFLAIEPVSGRMRDTPFTDELRRIAQEMTKGGRASR
jgi:hypothetical protein